MAIDYRIEETRDKLPEPPQLLEGEVVELEADRKLAPSVYIGVFCTAFVPPLFVLWWVVFIGGFWITRLLMRGRKERLLVTNIRLLHIIPSGRFYMVHSVPHQQVTDVRRTRVEPGIFELLLALLDKIFRVGDIIIVTPSNPKASMIIDNVKSPSKVIALIKEKAGIKL